MVIEKQALRRKYIYAMFLINLSDIGYIHCLDIEQTFMHIHLVDILKIYLVNLHMK